MSWRRRSRRSCRTRSKSVSRRLGRIRMSASSDAPRSAKRESVVSANDVASAPTSTSYSAPIRAKASETSIALRSPVPSSTMSAEIAASPSRPSGSATAPASTWTTMADDRHRVVLDGAHLQAVGQAVTGDAGKREGRIRTDVRQPRAIRAHHETETGSAPGKARCCWPRGTTLRSTRRSKPRTRRAVSLHRLRRRLAVARQILRRRTPDRREARCRRSAGRTCRRTRRRSAAGR